MEQDSAAARRASVAATNAQEKRHLTCRKRSHIRETNDANNGTEACARETEEKSEKQ